MQIGHIFNIVQKGKQQSLIETQPFEINYFISNNYHKYEDNSLDDDFSRKYYHALMPLEERGIISKYDDEKLKALTNNLGNDLVLISGDFWGIQKFIFDGITTSKASKILRSRSAMVQLITYAVVDRIKKEFNGSEALLFGAGKFMVLAKNENTHKIEEIQKELDKYFLENFFGQNGFIVSSTITTSEKILSQKDSMEDDLNSLGADNDDKKLNKFDLLNVEDDAIVHDIFDEAQKDDAICEFCSKRIKTHTVDDTKACNICFNEIELGKQLAKKPYVTIFSSNKLESKDNILIITLGNQNYYAKFEDEVRVKGDTFDISAEPYFDYKKWSLNSYVPKDKNDEIKDFSTLAEKSSGLMALKADIDKLGDTFRELYKKDFRTFNRLSREVEFFFSDYITSLVAKKENVYTVFAGGDDLFLIGEYKEIVSLAKEIRKEFYKFSLEKTTISMGLVMFKPSTPISFVSKMADEAEKRAKVERDSIDIFGISMKYKEFVDIEEKFKLVTNFLEKEKDDKTALYYRIIELCDMRENINKDVRNAMWKSKLNYLFRRNVKREDNNSEIFTILSNLIEKGEKFKPSIFLKIYNNRDNKKEKKNAEI